MCLIINYFWKSINFIKKKHVKMLHKQEVKRRFATAKKISSLGVGLESCQSG